MNKILEFYQEYDEESRLVKDNAHKIEFISTTKTLDLFIKPNSNILDIGAATGRYSFYYAQKNHNIWALDISPKHVGILKSKLNETKDVSINVSLGDSRDLAQFADNSFDVVLCMGPIYHLRKEEDRARCIQECLRVLKKGGILALAYVNKLACYIYYLKRDKDYINKANLSELLEKGYDSQNEEDCFFYSSYQEIENFMGKFDISKLDHIATDGITPIVRDVVNSFNAQEFDRWMEYHLATCRDTSIIGYSVHGLYICRKN